jgi:hypothetical protein
MLLNQFIRILPRRVMGVATPVAFIGRKTGGL